MFCNNCGKEIDDKAVVCVGCGVPVGQGCQYCSRCGASVSPGQVVCGKCGCYVKANPSYIPYNNGRSKLIAGLLGLFLGGIGVHRFYLGYIGIGIAQIIVSIVTCGIGSLWGFIEGIMILAGSINQDANGRALRDDC